MKKKILDHTRIRRVPSRFSWVDHRLIRRRLLARCSSQAWALFLLLVTVGDREGISYYSGASLCGHLNVEQEQLEHARRELILARLIAWEAPFYQVLALETCPDGSFPVAPAQRSGQVLDLAALLGGMLEGGEQ